MTERETTEMWKNKIENDCSDCNVCSGVCPASINIPSVISAYLRRKLRTDDSLSETPLDCIECGACSAHCPHRLDVMNMIRKIAMKQL